MDGDAVLWTIGVGLAVASVLQVVWVPLIARAQGRSGATWFMLAAIWSCIWSGGALAWASLTGILTVLTRLGGVPAVETRVFLVVDVLGVLACLPTFVVLVAGKDPHAALPRRRSGGARTAPTLRQDRPGLPPRPTARAIDRIRASRDRRARSSLALAVVFLVAIGAVAWVVVAHDATRSTTSSTGDVATAPATPPAPVTWTAPEAPTGQPHRLRLVPVPPRPGERVGPEMIEITDEERRKDAERAAARGRVTPTDPAAARRRMRDNFHAAIERGDLVTAARSLAELQFQGDDPQAVAEMRAVLASALAHRAGEDSSAPPTSSRAPGRPTPPRVPAANRRLVLLDAWHGWIDKMETDGLTEAAREDEIRSRLASTELRTPGKVVDVVALAKAPEPVVSVRVCGLYSDELSGEIRLTGADAAQATAWARWDRVLVPLDATIAQGTTREAVALTDTAAGLRRTPGKALEFPPEPERSQDGFMWHRWLERYVGAVWWKRWDEAAAIVAETTRSWRFMAIVVGRAEDDERVYYVQLEGSHALGSRDGRRWWGLGGELQCVVEDPQAREAIHLGTRVKVLAELAPPGSWSRASTLAQTDGRLLWSRLRLLKIRY